MQKIERALLFCYEVFLSAAYSKLNGQPGSLAKLQATCSIETCTGDTNICLVLGSGECNQLNLLSHA